MTPDPQTQQIPVTVKDYTTENKPDWCPGCGDFGILNALKKALVDLGKQPHEVTVIAGIGCSSKLPHWLNAYGFHTLHGRALPIATAARLSNTRNDVIVISGDGDGYGIGVGHLVHAARRNINVTMLAHNNQIYGLTTGQASPTTDLGHKTKTTPKGNVEMPVNPLALAIACGAGMVARSSAGDPKHLTETLKEGIQYRGFTLIELMVVLVIIGVIVLVVVLVRRSRRRKAQQPPYYPPPPPSVTPMLHSATDPGLR